MGAYLLELKVVQLPQLDRKKLPGLAGATLVEAVAATAEVTASPADVTIADGVTGVTDTLLAADGSRFLQLTSAFSTSSSGDGASGSSNDSPKNSSSAFGSPGVTQALCELKPAASPTSNESQQAQQQQQQQQQQSPRQLSLSFFARASLCTEGEGGAEGEAGRLLRVLLLAVPLNASAAATAGGDAAAGGGAGEGGAGEQVWAEWRVGGVTLHLVIRGVQDSNSSSNSTSGTATVTTTSGIATATSSVAASGSESSSIGATSATVAASMGGGGAGEGAGVKAAAVKRVDVASEAGGGAGAGSTAIDLASVMPTRSESERQKWLAGSQVCHSQPLPSQVLLPMALQHPRLTHSPSLPHPSSPPLPPFPPTPHPCHCPAADPSPLKSFSHWPLSSAHPLITAGSARRNSSSLSLTSLSDFNSASLALHPAPFALLAPASPASPCRPFSFSTSFTFRISSPNAAGLGGEGLAFVMLPTPTLGLPGPSLGYGRVLLPPGSTAGADNSSSSSGVSSQLLFLCMSCSLLLLLCVSAVLFICCSPLLLPLPCTAAQDRSLAVEFDTSKSLKHFSLPSLYHPQQHRSLAVEFDTSASLEFWDRPDHHVGVNLHGSMLSLASAPVHPLAIPALNAGQTLLATIHYNASSSHLTVYLSPAPAPSSSPPPPPPLSSRSSSSSASSPSSPSLPRSAGITTFPNTCSKRSPRFPHFPAVLSMFLDTCEWLGGNDPDAVSPPPPLLVGFTAATGKGAEQAQAHEVLGWDFQVGEAAEDPLPFWAADSFSFPYITPATPLLTRGSTKKRFFAADLSVAADVASSSGQSDDPAPGAIYFPRHTDPCKGSPVLPCGTGACTKARAPWDPSVLVPSCKCPLNLPSFQPSHLSGLPSCFPGETWSVVGKKWSAVGTRLLHVSPVPPQPMCPGGVH
ncbi:unnamed protein product [Closterium sp. NIES-64]|nr:unnamed protein product [Closterium sp. NIES-64]